MEPRPDNYSVHSLAYLQGRGDAGKTIKNNNKNNTFTYQPVLPTWLLVRPHLRANCMYYRHGIVIVPVSLSTWTDLCCKNTTDELYLVMMSVVSVCWCALCSAGVIKVPSIVHNLDFLSSRGLHVMLPTRNLQLTQSLIVHLIQQSTGHRSNFSCGISDEFNQSSVLIFAKTMN